MDMFLLLCKPIVVKNIIKPDIHHCNVVVRKCDTHKCVILPAEKPAPSVKIISHKNKW